MSRKPLVMADDAFEGLAAARRALDRFCDAAGDGTDRADLALDSAKAIFADLLSMFPSDYNLPHLRLRADTPTWGNWEDLENELRGAVDSQLLEADREISKKEKAEKTRLTKEKVRRTKIAKTMTGTKRPRKDLVTAYAKADELRARQPRLSISALWTKLQRAMPQDADIPSEKSLQRRYNGNRKFLDN